MIQDFLKWDQQDAGLDRGAAHSSLFAKRGQQECAASDNEEEAEKEEEEHDDIELSSIGDVSGSVRFSTNEKKLVDIEDDFSEGIDSELELADQMPTENEFVDDDDDEYQNLDKQAVGELENHPSQ